MKTFVLISAIIEILGGILLLVVPHVVPDLSQGGAHYLALARMHGATSLACGVFAIHVWRHMDNDIMVWTFLNTFLVLNIGVATAAYTCYAVGILTHPGGAVLHGVLALFTAYFYLKRKSTIVSGA